MNIMAPLDHTLTHSGQRPARPGSALVGWLLAAALFAALFLTAAFVPVAPDGPTLEPPAAQRQIEDWRGNSASIRPAG
jgi:hypothetical protein